MSWWAKMDDSWYDQYEDYQDYLASGGSEPEQDNPSDDWETAMQSEALTDQELNLMDDYWAEYANGERSDYEIMLQILYGG
jgi:hypothetical protein